MIIDKLLVDDKRFLLLKKKKVFGRMSKDWHNMLWPLMSSTWIELKGSNWAWLVKVRWYQLKVDLLFDPQLFSSNLPLLSGMQQQKHGETQQKVVKDIEAFTCSMQVFFSILWLILAVCFWPSRVEYFRPTRDGQLCHVNLPLWIFRLLQADWEAIEEPRIGVGPIGTQNLGSWKKLPAFSDPIKG